MIGLGRNTQYWSNWWKHRKIDWNKDYLATWNHPHRQVISYILSRMQWSSLFEVGCGSGPNLVQILKSHKGKHVGGCDVNADAIELAKQTFAGGHFKVSSADDVMMSDNSTDVVLSDMCIIYFKNPNEVMKEIRRITRNYVIFSELHTESWWMRLKLRWSSGYHAHNYKKLLDKHGFVNVEFIKMSEETWPGGHPQKDYGYFIIAKKANI